LFYFNSLFLLIYDSDSKESIIVSRYVSSIKKKPSLQAVINRAKKHPYQTSMPSSDEPTSQDVSTITRSSLNNKRMTELVYKSFYLYISEETF